jgi:hypothetical protein
MENVKWKTGLLLYKIPTAVFGKQVNLAWK